MNFSELVESVQGQNDTGRGMSEEIVHSVFHTIALSLSKGEEVRLAGFGAFKVKTRKARTARNPVTGAAIQVPAKKVVKFTPYSKLKESV